MELLALHDQLIPNLPTDDQEDDLVALDNVQDSKVAGPNLEFGERIGTKAFDGVRWRRRLVRETGDDCRLQGPTLPGGESPQ